MRKGGLYVNEELRMIENFIDEMVDEKRGVDVW